MSPVISTKGAEGCEVHGGRRGALHKEAERQLIEGTGRDIVRLGMGFTAIKLSLKKIAGKDSRERNRRSLHKCLHTAGQKKASQI